MNIGVLALQGDFANHAERLRELGANTQLVKSAQALESIDALVLPGGESSAMLKLMREDLESALCEKISGGLPTFATCAGIILLAHRVSNPTQRSLKLLDVDVVRNAYGRHAESFIDASLRLSERGIKAFSLSTHRSAAPLEAVFIRAPKMSRVGASVEVLATQADDPVLLRQGAILAATFHPELSSSTHVVLRYFLDSIVGQ